MNDPGPLVLCVGDSRCEVYPGLGGSIGRWSVGDQEMLRVASAGAIAAHEPLGMATFPLVPYSNRIGFARFEWAGRPIALTPNFTPEPHAIHGVGWKRSWEATEQSAAAVTLVLSHSGDHNWPWAFDAVQQIVLTETALTITMCAVNRAETAAPLGFGHHPYFDQAKASLNFAAATVWMADDNALPTVAIQPRGQFDFGTAAPVAGRNIDNCFSGVSGPATIRWTDRALQLEITSSPQLGAAVVYVPDGGDAFCFEPVPHINNALNLPGHAPAMPVLDQGQKSETALTFRAFSK